MGRKAWIWLWTAAVGALLAQRREQVGNTSGAIVIRRADDGDVLVIDDVPGVADIEIAPDSSAFVYGTVTGQTHTALVRVPLR